MKIKAVEKVDKGYVIIMDSNIRWDIPDDGDGIYIVDCHVFGPDDIDEWVENAKTMLAFYEVVKALQEICGELDIRAERFTEPETAAYIYLEPDDLAELLEWNKKNIDHD